MGLDVYLYRFQEVDTDAILKLSQFSEEPWAFESFHKWNAMPQSERGSFPSEQDRVESGEKMICKARELGLPGKIATDACYGGKPVCVLSKKYPGCDIGTWGGLDVAVAITKHFLGKNVYFIFPEAKGDPHFFRPNWSATKARLSEILPELKKVTQAQLESFLPSYWELFPCDLEAIEIVIETMDYVLSQSEPKQFLLCWSN